MKLKQSHVHQLRCLAPVAMSGTCMNTLMLNKIGTLGEGLPTQPACIGLLSCVNPLVLNKACSLTKIFVTLITFIGSLSSMSSSMLIK